MGGYYAAGLAVFVMWNRITNDDDWSTALWHGATFSVVTGGIVMLWFLRRRSTRAGSASTGHDG
jgi:uncharacterized membrane protein